MTAFRGGLADGQNEAAAESREPRADSPHPPRRQKLLAQVAQYYRRRFALEPRAKKYLDDRGLKDPHALEIFAAGYCDGTLKDVLPFDDQVSEDLRALGILKDNGKELFAECVTFPLWSTAGACVGMYGRRLFKSEVAHLYLPGPRRGLLNFQSAKRAATPGAELVLTESILDALSLYVAGVVNVIPCYGTGGFTDDHRELLQRFRPARLAVCFDGDASGKTAAQNLATELQAAAKWATVRVVALPADTDPNALLVDRGPAALANLVGAAVPKVSRTTPAQSTAPAQAATPTQAAAPSPPPHPSAIEKTATGFALHRGMGGAVYSIRALQSGDELRVAATAKDPVTGKMKTEEYVVKAKASVMMTTTNPNFDEETKSRFLLATVNESAELTRKILEVQRHAETIEGIAMRRHSDRVRRVHQNAQRLLAPVVVANPFAPSLTFPSQSIQARRDNKKYLGLIKAVALLHQHQRETKTRTLYGETLAYIEATLSDIALANRIARDVLASRHGDVTPQARQLLSLIRKMLLNGGGHDKDATGTFNRRRLREHTGWSDWQVKTHLGELVELEYLLVRQGTFGKEYVYELADTHLLEALPGFGLTEVEALRAVLAPAPKSRSRNLVAS